MKKLIFKSVLYVILILLALEVLVRIFHLYTEDPPRYIDEFEVEKRVPNHQGYSVTGNRNQNFSEFNINSSGFNSENEFHPTENKIEIAIIGDSFIEGFHEDYNNSTGEKIEEKLPDVEVYEYGYAGYDLANQLHLIHAYENDFKLIDKIIIYLNYESDLGRGEYEPNSDRIKMLNSTVFKIRDNIKLISYASKIGILDNVKRIVQGKTREEVNSKKNIIKTDVQINEENQIKIDNFKNLIKLYGFDKNKTSILFDSRKTSKDFIEYCNIEGIDLIDFADSFEKSKEPTTLIYDHHWNTNGRQLIADEIVSHLKNTIKFD